MRDATKRYGGRLGTVKTYMPGPNGLK